MRDIQLRKTRLQPQRDEFVLQRHERRAVRRLPDAEVRLEADAVDRRGRGLDLLDDAEGAGGFGGGRFQVEVVVVELGRGVGGAGEGEGQREEGRAEDLREDRGAQGAVLGEGFVDDVPGVAEGFVVRDDRGDVRGQDGGEGGARPGAVLDWVGVRCWVGGMGGEGGGGYRRGGAASAR